jgi:anti-anti-sigma factor
VRLLRLAGTGHPLVADLDRVSFIDAAGLGALAGAARRAAAHGASLRVVCARPRIRRLFRVTGLDQAVPLAGTLDEALGMLASTAKAEAV